MLTKTFKDVEVIGTWDKLVVIVNCKVIEYPRIVGKEVFDRCFPWRRWE